MGRTASRPPPYDPGMPTVRWDRARALATIDPLDVDDLDGRTLVVDGITRTDDARLDWVRRAPCVVIGTTPDGDEPSSVVDVTLPATSAGDTLDDLLDRIDANPHAARVLVDVLRAMPELDVPTGLTIESLAYSALLAGPEFGGHASRFR